MPALIGVAERARVGETVCGDLGAVIRTHRGILLCLADGLGHGEQARASAEVVTGYVRERCEQPLASLLHGIDAALAGRRGAAVSLLSLRPLDGCGQYAGVGNVELRALAQARIAPPTAAGIAGRGVRTARVWDFPVADGDLFVLFSDGISSRFDLATLAHLAPQALANEIVARHHKDHDDASCLVAKVVLR